MLRGSWAKQPPRSTTTLEAALNLCRTPSARAIVEFYLAWLGDTGGAVPRKADFDPSRLGRLANHVFLFAVTVPDACVVRVVAEQARHHTGPVAPWSDYYENVPKDRLRIARWAMNMAVEVPCGFRVDVRHDYALGRTREFESLLLPMASDEDGVDGFLLGTSELAGDDADRALPGEKSIGNVVLRRDLIDLGHGVDEAFYDLVPRS